MRAALVTEYRKLVTTRMWWILLLTMAVLMAFFGAFMAFAVTAPGATGAGGAGEMPALPDVDAALSAYSIAAGFGYVFPVIAGALSVTNEFRHMTVTPTLLAEPRRTVVLVAKLLGAIPVGVVFGVVGTLATVAGAAAVLAATGVDPSLGDAEVLRGLGLSVLALVLWTLIGVAFGTVLKNQVAAIVLVLAYNQLVEPLVRLFLGATDWGADITRFLPGAAAEALVGSSFFTAVGAGDLLTWWQGLLVLLAYVAVLSLVGRLTTLRRDIT